MSLWRHFAAGLRTLGNRKAKDREIADEISHYLDESAAEFVSRGLSPEEARRTVAVMEAATRSIAEGGARLEVDI